jgi:outer membrane biosynthesis protein TonB
VQPAERTVEPVEVAKPKPTFEPGDLTMAKPSDVVRSGEGQAERERPRTIKEALARKQELAQYSGLAGEKMKQDGGVRRQARVPSLNVRATGFGAYDAAVIAAVQNRWYYLLDQREYAAERTGKVGLEFKLHSDGRITDMKVTENTVTELLSILCQKAVLDPTPYDKWPSDMRKMIGTDTREITFTFYYY